MVSCKLRGLLLKYFQRYVFLKHSFKRLSSCVKLPKFSSWKIIGDSSICLTLSHVFLMQIFNIHPTMRIDTSNHRLLIIVKIKYLKTQIWMSGLYFFLFLLFCCHIHIHITCSRVHMCAHTLQFRTLYLYSIFSEEYMTGHLN